MKARAALVAAALLGGCTDAVFDPWEGRDAQELYRELWTAFDEHYAPFTERGVDWDAEFARHAPAAEAGDDALFASMTGLLAELDDGHVTLVAPGRLQFVAKRTFRENTFQLDLDLGIIAGRMVEGPFRAGAALYGALPDDVGYVHVANWNDPVPDLDGLIAFLAERRAAIVDLRHNPGGDFTNGFPFAARFADERRLAFTTWTRTGRGHQDMGQPVDWRIGPEGAVRFDGPVVILTNGFTNSAAERTLMAFRTFPHATVVGSRTAGNHGEKVGGELSNGWRYSTVPQVVVAADGVSYEGPGLPPDLEVQNDAAEVAAGLDRQFEAALEVLGAGGRR